MIDTLAEFSAPISTDAAISGIGAQHLKPSPVTTVLVHHGADDQEWCPYCTPDDDPDSEPGMGTWIVDEHELVDDDDRFVGLIAVLACGHQIPSDLQPYEENAYPGQWFG